MRNDHQVDNYVGCRVTVFGLGSFGGGVGAVRFLAERGALVTITDRRTPEHLQESLEQLQGVPIARWRWGKHRDEDFLNADLVIVNPAIRRDHPLIQLCVERGIPLTSEMNLFWQHNPARVIAVTGSNGKSTTTALIHSILQTGTQPCWLGGNLGRSLLPEVDAITATDWVILELSSFQLADLNRLEVSPHAAVVTNFSPNHLDWHRDLADYRSAKQTILRWQSSCDIAVLNAVDGDVANWKTRGRTLWFSPADHGQDGMFLRGKSCIWRERESETKLPLSDWLTLPGAHNLQNAMAAACVALALGHTPRQVEHGLRHYQPLPHRLQFVGEVQGRLFYNDSLATTPESTSVALDAFDRPIVLLAGGYDKQVDLAAMASKIAIKAKAVVVMGQTAGVLESLVTNTAGRACQISSGHLDFRSAFQAAVAHAAPGDIVLLSPGCASYDWFRNFADRGDQFTQLVREL